MWLNSVRTNVQLHTGQSIKKSAEYVRRANNMPTKLYESNSCFTLLCNVVKRVYRQHCSFDDLELVLLADGVTYLQSNSYFAS